MPLSNRARALYLEVGRLVAERRRALPGDVTQADVAARTSGELSRSAVANIETGRHRVALHQLFILADALTCDLEELLPEPESLQRGLKIPRGATEGDEAALDLMKRLGSERGASLPTQLGDDAI